MSKRVTYVHSDKHAKGAKDCHDAKGQRALVHLAEYNEAKAVIHKATDGEATSHVRQSNHLVEVPLARG